LVLVAFFAARRIFGEQFVAFSEDEKEALRSAVSASGIDVQYQVLGPDGRTPVLTDVVGFYEWCRTIGGNRTSVQIADEDVGDVRVSTIFLSQIVISGSDWLAKTPFETMVLDGVRSLGLTRKYTSWAEAEIGHKEVVAEVLELSPDQLRL
jgi:hypothetical protein